MMMNILALFLVLSSIGVEVLSPNPEKKNSRGEDMIVKETHRVVLIEYEREIEPINKENQRLESNDQKPNTESSSPSPTPSARILAQSNKQSPSSSSSSVQAQSQKPFDLEQRGFQSASSLVGNANEKMTEACSVLPNLGYGISGESLSKACEMSKQVVDEGLDKAKDLASYKAHLVEEGVKGAKSAAIETGKKIEQGFEKAKEKTHDFKEAFDYAKESAVESFKERLAEKIEWEKEAIGDTKEKILEKTHDFKEAFDDAKESATESFKKKLAEKLEWEKEAIGDAKEKILEKTHDFKEAFNDAKESATESFKKIPQRLVEKVEWEKEAIGGAKEKILEKTQDLSEGIGDVKEKTKRFIPQTLSRGKWKVLDKAYDLKEAVEETASKVKEKVLEKTSTVEEAKEKIPEKLNEAKDKILEKSQELKGVSEETAMKAKEMVLDKAHELEASSKETIETATERAKRFLGDLKETYNKIETAVNDDRTAKVKTTHFLIEGSHNFTSLFTKSFLSVYHTSDETVNWSVGVLCLMGFATAYGSCVWVTFVSSHVLSGALPRQQYGMVQSKIYPVYFRVMAYTLGLSYLGHFLTRHHDKSSPSEKLNGYDLMASIGMVLVNLFFLEPLATKVMLDIMKREKEEGRGTAAEASSVGGSRMVGEVEAEGSERQAEGEVREENGTQHQAQLERLNKRLKKLNTISAFCNILTLMALTSHLASLSHGLYASCS